MAGVRIYNMAVYVLKDEMGATRYVGVSKHPGERLSQHIREARVGRTHRHRWVQSVIDRGYTPSLEVVEWSSDWDEAERRWVAALKSQGCDLVNGNDGGKTMHQARAKSEIYPNIKRAYRLLEKDIRWAEKKGNAALADKCKKAKDSLLAAVSRCRGTSNMSVLNENIGRVCG